MGNEAQGVFIVPGAGTMIVGSEHVSKKLVALAQYMLWDMPDLVAGEDAILEHNVLMITFDIKLAPTTASGKQALSAWYSDTRTICVYLRNILDDAWGVVKTRKNRCSVSMLAWNTKIRCLLHELRHSQFMLAAGDDETPTDVLEKDAEDWVDAMMPKLARVMGIEPPTLADMPWVGAQSLSRFAEAVKEPTGSGWVGLQQQLLEHKLLYMSVKGTKTMKSLREFYMKKALDAGDPPAEWAVKPLVAYFTARPLDVVAAVLTDATKPAEPQPAPIPAQAPPSPAGPPPPPAESLAYSNPLPIGVTSYAGMEFYGDNDGEEEIDTGAADGPVDTNEPVETPAAPQNGGRVYTPIPPPQVIPNGLTGAQIVPMLHAVYVGCWTHIFTKCGQLANSDQAFNNAGAVLERISFGHIPGIDNVVTHMDCSVPGPDGVAKWTSQVPVVNGVIWGHVSKANVPMYSLYINVNGTVIRRLLMPANPTSSGKLGQGARRGERHLLVMDGDKAKGAQGAVIGVVSTGVNGQGYYRSFT